MNDMQDSGSITEYPQHRLTADIHERGIVPQPEPAPKMLQGLTTGEVIARRARGLGNSARPKISRTYVQIFIENTFTFTNNILYTLGIALVLLGQVSDALVSVGIVLSNTIVGVVQEIRAKRILDRIALLTRPQATVLRDGTEQTIDPGEVVLGD